METDEIQQLINFTNELIELQELHDFINDLVFTGIDGDGW